MAGAPKTGLTAAGKIVVTIVVLALVGVGVYLMRDTLFPKGTSGQVGTVDLDRARSLGLGGEQQAEAIDPTGITTVTEYEFVPAQTLPPVEGASAYKWNPDDPTVVFPINVWIGWLPLVAANRGFAPNQESMFFQEYGFKVQFQLIDDPVRARDVFVQGDSHILWGTLDMMALFASGLLQDSRTAPRIYQQIDWSSGGDGIVVREGINSVADLRGKTIVYAQNSPSEYYINTLLLSAGVQPAEVKPMYTTTAFEASAAFVSNASIDACVSWAPDIYNIPDNVPGTKILSTTADANKVIADVWAARADFAKDHPEIIEGLVECTFEAMERLETDEEFRAAAIQWLADGYDFPAEEIEMMLLDAHSTNFAENKQFFLNARNPTNLERTWERVNFVYSSLKPDFKAVAFDQVIDFSIIQKLDAAGTFAHQTDTYSRDFVPTDWEAAESEPVLKQIIRIHFPPNSADLKAKKDDGTPYDPNIDQTLEQVATLTGQYERAAILVTGHTDDSNRNQRPQDLIERLVQELSDDRAQAVRQALIDRYDLDPDRIKAEGRGWKEPANPNRPHDHAMNRRVEVGVYPLESE
jgi:NitT/TauT family transport system substrate-binding protein